MWLNARDKKFLGLVLLLPGIATGIAAQVTLFYSTRDLGELLYKLRPLLCPIQR